MSPLLMGLLGVMLVPFFVATWRMSLLGLAFQGLLIGWIAYRFDSNLASLDNWLKWADLVVVRAVVAPLLLRQLMKPRFAAGHSDITPPNLFSWTVAFGLVLAAFNLSSALIPIDGDARALVSVAAAGVLLGLLMLATQSSATGQVIGALRLENGIALLELGSEAHTSSVVHVGQVGIVAATIGLYAWLLREAPSTMAEAAGEEPTL